MKNLPKITSYYYVEPEQEEIFLDPILQRDFDTLEELFLYAFSHDFEYDESRGKLIKEQVYTVRIHPQIDANFKAYWELQTDKPKIRIKKYLVLNKDREILGELKSYDEAKGMIKILENSGHTDLYVELREIQ